MKKKKPQGGPKKAATKQTNPFEIKVHKVKHEVLGKKSSKEVLGNPNKKKQKVRQLSLKIEVVSRECSVCSWRLQHHVHRIYEVPYTHPLALSLGSGRSQVVSLERVQEQKQVKFDAGQKIGGK